MLSQNDIALFVGGPWDGRRQKMLHDNAEHYVPVLQPIDIRMLGHREIQPNAVTSVRYHRVRYADLLFYVVSDPVNNAAPSMYRLLDMLSLGYRLPRERKDGY